MTSIKSKKISNRASGNHFEMDFAMDLAKHGWWAHVMKQDSSGQPADVIAVYHGYAYLIDCKVCADNRFDLSRIEPNQWDAMQYWLNLHGSTPLFALKDGDGQVWMLDYIWARSLMEEGVKSVKCEERGHRLWGMEDWLEWICR